MTGSESDLENKGLNKNKVLLKFTQQFRIWNSNCTPVVQMKGTFIIFIFIKNVMENGWGTILQCFMKTSILLEL